VPRGIAVDPYSEFERALIFGVLFASWFSLLAHLRRAENTGLRKLVDLAMGNWDYALIVFASVGAGIMYGYFYRLGREELIVILLATIAPLGVTRFLVKRHLRRKNETLSQS
jgi:hypothetical protein